MDTLARGPWRLAYRDEGSGLPVVFIHGVATPGELWAPDLSALASEFRVIVYDRRGYGGSSASPRNWDAHEQDAAALIESLQAWPAHVVGYSAGGTIALKLALERPDLVAGLTFLEPVFNVRRCMTAEFLFHVGLSKMLRRLGHERRGAEHWLRYVSSYSTGGSAFASKASPARREKLLAGAAGIFADFESSGADVDEGRIARIAVPVTIIETALSPEIMRRCARRLHALVPQARFSTLARSGHWAGLDAREELLSLLRGSVRAPAREARGRR